MNFQQNSPMGTYLQPAPHIEITFINTTMNIKPIPRCTSGGGGEYMFIDWVPYYNSNRSYRGNHNDALDSGEG